MKDYFKKTVYHEKKFEPKGMNKQKGNNKREGTNENETYRTIQAFFLLLIVLMLCYQGIRNGSLQYDLLENGETRYGYATYQKKEGTFVSLTLGYSFHRSIVYTVTAIMFFYSLISVRRIHGRLRSFNPLYSLYMMYDLSFRKIQAGVYR